MSVPHFTMKKYQITVFLIVLLGQVFCQSSEYVPGKSYYGEMKYTEYIAGNLPLVISVPHDGEMMPEFIPDRKKGGAGRDFGTLEIALEMIKGIKEKTGKYPHVIIMHLARKKLDANREENEAAQENLIALETWEEYHGYIESALIQAEREYGMGFFIDFHGQRHPEGRIEIGYCLDNELIMLPDEDLDSEEIMERSSIKKMSEQLKIKHSELIRGGKSLGAILDKYRVKSTPSPSDPFPGLKNYFSGGYTTTRHAVMSEGNVSGLQIELNEELREQRNVKATAEMLVDALLEYLAIHYGKDIFNGIEE